MKTTRQFPVGVFDSGVGGLSVLHAVRERLPQHPLVYVADSAWAPYGDRSPEFIRERTDTVCRFLVRQKVGAIVIACNTASVHAAQSIRKWSPVPLVAMEPAIKPGVLLSRSGVIGVLATTQTLASENVLRLVSTFGADTRILLQACPGLVELVEQGKLESPETLRLLRSYLVPLLDNGADTLVLGCTHYPFLRSQIASIAGPHVQIIDPAPAVARELARRLGMDTSQTPATGLLADGRTLPIARPDEAGCNIGGERFFSSGHILSVQSTIRSLWRVDATVSAMQDSPPSS